MKNVLKTLPLDLVELSRKTGLIPRQPDSATIGDFFSRLEEYDEQERAHTSDFLKLAINQNRSLMGADAAYDDQLFSCTLNIARYGSRKSTRRRNI